LYLYKKKAYGHTVTSNGIWYEVTSGFVFSIDQ